MDTVWPAQFDYLAPAAEIIGDRTQDDEMQLLIKSLSADDLHVLGKVYEQIIARQDEPLLDDWLDNPPGSANVSFQSARSRMFSLLIFFDHLADANIHPFASHAGRFEKACVPPRLDWSELPRSLDFIKDIARNYGGYQSERLLRRLLRRLSADERMRIRLAVKQLNQGQTRFALDEWCLSREDDQRLTGDWGHAALGFLNWIEDKV